MSGDGTKCFAVALRVMGDSLDPALLESLLGLPPDVIGIRGRPRLGKQGRQYAPYETNLWLHRENSGPEAGFDQRIQNLLTRLGSGISALRRLSSAEGVETEIMCGFSSGSGQGGDTLRPETLRLLAETGISLTLDLYPPGVDAMEPDTLPVP